MHDHFTHPTYDEIHDACVEVLAPAIASTAGIIPTRIVGLSRGGMIPATIISHCLRDLPVTPVSYSSKSGQGDDKNHHNVLPEVEDECLLIVDDICDSGLTLKEVFSGYSVRGHQLTTAVLYYKEMVESPIVPHFQWRIIPATAPWIIFPWECN